MQPCKSKGLNWPRRFIKVLARDTLTPHGWDSAINLPGWFRLLLLTFIRKTKNAWLKNPTDLQHKNLMKSLLALSPFFWDLSLNATQDFSSGAVWRKHCTTAMATATASLPATYGLFCSDQSSQGSKFLLLQYLKFNKSTFYCKTWQFLISLIH